LLLFGLWNPRSGESHNLLFLQTRNVMFDIPAPAVSVTVRHVTTPLVVVQLYRTLGRIPSLEDGPIHQSVLPVAVLVLVAANAESRREKDKLFGCK
jgi:hypothetical protein